MPLVGQPILTGQPGAFRQPGRWGRNESGNFDTWSFEGSKQAVYNLAATFAQTIGLAYDVTESFGKFRLDVYFPWNMHGINPATDLVIKWELFAQEVEKDLLSARGDVYGAGGSLPIANLSTGQVQSIRNFLNQPPDGTTTPYPTASSFQNAGETNGSLALQVYSLMQQGVTAFPVEAPVLRRTWTTSNQYGTQYALSNVGRIISTNTLRNTEAIPGSLLFGLPNDTWTDPDPSVDTPALNYGWRKKYPTVQQVALLKWNIVQEWHYGLWAYLLYGNPL